MKIIKLNCAACGAPISIPENLEQLTCSNCGTHLMLEHGEGYYALKAVEQLSEAIQQSGRGTQDAIREGAQVTQKELKRLQLTQALGSANTALNATQSEQRSLTRVQVTPAVMNQIQELRLQEVSQREDIRRFQLQLDLLDGQPIESNSQALTTQINYLNKSIAVLRACNQNPRNQQILQVIIQEKQKYEGYLNAIKANQLREKIPSFSVKPPFSTDLNELVKQLRRVQTDLENLSRHAPSAVRTRLMQELTKFNNQLYQHYHQEVYRQCWGNTRPDSDPGQDYDKLSHHLNASRTTAQWLSAVPTGSKAVENEIKQFQKSEKRLAKSFGKAQEHHRFNEALRVIRTGLTALSITGPLSSNLQEVRGQVAVYQKDIQSLQGRPSSPEVKQVQKELNGRYQELYRHWASLEKQSLESQLKSGSIQPPFSDDFTQARADYDLVTADVQMLKGKTDIPGAQELIKPAVAKQRLLYAHLQEILASRENESSSEG